jgi:hypothetical protein
VVIRDVPNAVVAEMVELASVANLVAEPESQSNREAEAARIPAQDWTTACRTPPRSGRYAQRP